MVTFPSQLAPLLNTVPAWALALSMLVVSLILIFAGRKVVKFIAFLVVGLIGATIGGALMAQYLTGLGSLGILVGALVGFVIGGLLGVALLAVGIGLVMGYAAYLLTQGFVSGATIPLVVGIVFGLVGIALHNKILSFITALAGGLLLFDVLVAYGLNSTLSIILAAALTLAGIWVQEVGRKKMIQQTAPNVPGQPR